jgi:hypothetical protein
VVGGAPAFVAPHEIAREVTANSGTEDAAQCGLLRDIFGNPFRPVSLAPAWMTPDVLNLAQATYDNRLLPSGLLDNTGLGILADALARIIHRDAESLVSARV